MHIIIEICLWCVQTFFPGGIILLIEVILQVREPWSGLRPCSHAHIALLQLAKFGEFRTLWRYYKFNFRTMQEFAWLTLCNILRFYLTASTVMSPMWMLPSSPIQPSFLSLASLPLGATPYPYLLPYLLFPTPNPLPYPYPLPYIPLSPGGPTYPYPLPYSPKTLLH